MAVYTGHDAIAAFDRDSERVVAMVTDVRIGDGPTGWEVARHMRSVNPTLPVIYMSADGARTGPHLGYQIAS
ncbi:MAG: hypothetical protein E5Y02_32920 [Mesorhizobium sp.]|nr:MAG: hypothetical protein E5Y02_32920 [Mesorhizobium sp.]